MKQPERLSKPSISEFSPMIQTKLIKFITRHKIEEAQKLKEYRKKQFNYRRNVVQELINTESCYVKDLEIAWAVIEQLNYNEAETRKIASNLNQVIQCNKTILQIFLDSIKEENERVRAIYGKYSKQKVYGWNYSKLFERVSQECDIFKCYFPYCSEYDDAFKYRENLKKTDARYAMVVSNAEKSQEFRSLDLEGFLVKPIQRLPKYILLLKDLLKHSTLKEDKFPDYEKISDCLKNFESINEQNNSSIEAFIVNQQKLKEIQKYIGDKFNIISESRILIFEEAVTLFVQPAKEIPIVLYCFNDSVLLLKRIPQVKQETKYKYIGWQPFTLQSQCQSIPDSEYKQNLFKLSGMKTIYIIIAQTNLEKERLIQKINTSITLCRKEQFHSTDSEFEQVTIKVEGTEQYNLASMNNYTVYVIALKLEHLQWKLYLRYSEIKKIYQYLKDDMKLSTLMEISWFKNHDNKALEMLKINIENLFQQIFDNLPTYKNPSKVLDMLNMPKEFFKLNKLKQKEREYEQVLKRKHTLSNIEDSSDSFNPGHFLDSGYQTQLEIQNFINPEGAQESSQTQETQIKIHIPGGSVQVEKISKTTTAIQLCQKIATQLTLDKFYDFRLFITDRIGNSRILENNQVIINAIPNDPYIFGDDSFGNRTQIIFTRIFDEQYILEFKKYFYLPKEYEEFKNDPNRLKLMAFQFADQMKLCSGKFTIQQLALLYSLYIISKYSDKKLDDIRYSSSRLASKLKKLVRKEERKKYSIFEWQKIIKQTFNDQYKKLQKILKNNKNLYNQGTQMEEAKPEIYQNIHNLAMLALVNFAYLDPLYGARLFYVGLTIQTMEALKPFLKQAIPNLYIALKHNCILFLSPGSQKILYNLDYNYVVSIISEPLFIEFRCEIDQVKYDLRFRSIDGYRISRMIEDYREFSKIIQK